MLSFLRSQFHLLITLSLSLSLKALHLSLSIDGYGVRSIPSLDLQHRHLPLSFMYAQDSIQILKD